MRTIQLATAWAVALVFAALGSAGSASAKDVVVLHTTMGDMTAELYPDVAPKTVANFKELARTGFFDGVRFHRIIKGFVVQTGDPNSRTGDATTWGTGGSGKSIPGEFSTQLKHTEGVLSMARTSDPNSATSQFFICLGDAPSLDGKYAIFGKVTKGLPILRKIGASPVRKSWTGETSQPVRPPVLKKVTVKTV